MESMKFVASCALCILYLFISIPYAHAEWYRASGSFFVVYANQDQNTTIRFAEELDRFHKALDISARLGKKKRPSPSNRLTIFAVGSEAELKKLFSSEPTKVLGFYKPQAGGSVAFVPNAVNGPSAEAIRQRRVLLHEYSHHYMISNTNLGTPKWFNEGFAEFYSAAKFNGDGSVELGMLAPHRIDELKSSRSVPWKVILDTRSYNKWKNFEYDSFYGQSWLLYRYLRLSSGGTQKLDEFITRLKNGEKELKAAELSFGNLERLEIKLEKHLQNSSPHIKIAKEKIATEAVELEKLGPAESSLMPIYIKLRKGMARGSIELMLDEIRTIAKTNHGSAFVFSILSEAELKVGNIDSAIAAADKALAIDQKNVDARLLKGFALFEKAKKALNADAAWVNVREHFSSISRVESDHPVPLIRYYQSYLQQDQKPPSRATRGLERALEIAPYDKNVRFMVSLDQFRNKRFFAARKTLFPLAYGSHKSRDRLRALILLAQIENAIAKQNDNPDLFQF